MPSARFASECPKRHALVRSLLEVWGGHELAYEMKGLSASPDRLRRSSSSEDGDAGHNRDAMAALGLHRAVHRRDFDAARFLRRRQASKPDAKVCIWEAHDTSKEPVAPTLGGSRASALQVGVPPSRSTTSLIPDLCVVSKPIDTSTVTNTGDSSPSSRDTSPGRTPLQAPWRVAGHETPPLAHASSHPRARGGFARRRGL